MLQIDHRLIIKLYIFTYTIIIIFLQEYVIYKYLNIRNTDSSMEASSPPSDPFFAIVGYAKVTSQLGTRQLNFETRLWWIETSLVYRYSRSFVFHLLVKKLRVRDFVSFLFYSFLIVISVYCSRCMSRSCKNFRCHRCRTSFIRSTLASKKRSRDYLSIFRSRQKTHLFQMVSQFI